MHAHLGGLVLIIMTIWGEFLSLLKEPEMFQPQCEEAQKYSGK